MNEFASIPEPTESNFNKPVFTKVVSGYPITLRILDKKAYSVYKHFLPKQRISVVCLGYDVCPICQNNSRLADENPNVPYNEVKGIINRQLRFMVNVYNRTVAKVTPNGTVIYANIEGKFPEQNFETGEIFTGIEAKPLNRVEVLERGKTLFADLNNRNNMVRDPDTGEPVGLWNYDIVLLASGKGRDMTISVETRPHQNDEIDVPVDDLFVLETVPLQLSPDEMIRALQGVSLSDIFAERKAQAEIEREEDRNDAVLNDLSEQAMSEVKEEIDELFDEEED